MDKELAQVMVCIFQNCSSLLNHTIWLMDSHSKDAGAALEHREAVVRVMAELGTQLLYPIYDKYPDLDPSSPTFIGDRLAQSPVKPLQVDNQPDPPNPGDRKS